MAENTPNKPDDKKTAPAKETAKKENAVPANESVKTDSKAPDNKEPEKAAVQDAGKSDQDKKENPAPDNKKTDPKKVVPFTPEKKAEVKGDSVKIDNKTEPSLSPTDEKLKKEQEALLKSLDEKAALNEKKNAAPKKKQEGKPPKGPKEEAPAKEPETEKPPEPVEAPRPDKKAEVVYIKLNELFPFKNHPFAVRDDAELRKLVESVKDKGVTQPVTVRPREGGGYEMVSGHRRQKASELAGFLDVPCIIKNLTDEQAITEMVEDNTTQREIILPSEKAKALKMQLEAIKRQGVRDGSNSGQRSDAIVGERNNMSAKVVQRFIKLNDLVPDLMKYVDQKIDKMQIGFMTAFELAFIKPKNQNYIAVAIEGNQSTPSQAQAQRMRELDQHNQLNPDVIDGILMEQKKEVDKVILSSQELGQYFGKDKTPQDMKATIIELLEEYKAKHPELSAPDKKEKQPEK